MPRKNDEEQNAENGEPENGEEQSSNSIDINIDDDTVQVTVPRDGNAAKTLQGVGKMVDQL